LTAARIAFSGIGATAIPIYSGTATWSVHRVAMSASGLTRFRIATLVYANHAVNWVVKVNYATNAAVVRNYARKAFVNQSQ
jgi:hypothetical protein